MICVTEKRREICVERKVKKNKNSLIYQKSEKRDCRIGYPTSVKHPIPLLDYIWPGGGGVGGGGWGALIPLPRGMIFPRISLVFLHAWLETGSSLAHFRKFSKKCHRFPFTQKLSRVLFLAKISFLIANCTLESKVLLSWKYLAEIISLLYISHNNCIDFGDDSHVLHLRKHFTEKISWS